MVARDSDYLDWEPTETLYSRRCSGMSIATPSKRSQRLVRSLDCRSGLARRFTHGSSIRAGHDRVADAVCLGGFHPPWISRGVLSGSSLPATSLQWRDGGGDALCHGVFRCRWRIPYDCCGVEGSCGARLLVGRTAPPSVDGGTQYLG